MWHSSSLQGDKKFSILGKSRTDVEGVSRFDAYGRSLEDIFFQGEKKYLSF